MSKLNSNKTPALEFLGQALIAAGDAYIEGTSQLAEFDAIGSVILRFYKSKETDALVAELKAKISKEGAARLQVGTDDSYVTVNNAKDYLAKLKGKQEPQQEKLNSSPVVEDDVPPVVINDADLVPDVDPDLPTGTVVTTEESLIPNDDDMTTTEEVSTNAEDLNANNTTASEASIYDLSYLSKVLDMDEKEIGEIYGKTYRKLESHAKAIGFTIVKSEEDGPVLDFVTSLSEYLNKASLNK